MKDSRASSPNRKSTKSLWTSAVRKIVSNKNERDEDELGEHVATILNEHPSFRYQPKVDTVTEDVDESIGPLLSIRNLKKCYHGLTQLKHPSQFFKLFLDFVSYICKDRQSIFMGLYILGWMSLLSATTLAIPCQMTVLWMTNGVLYFWSLSSMFLIDVEEIKSIFPKQILYALGVISKVLAWIDSFILMGSEYAGREWNSTHFVAGVGEATSRNTTLMKCPPPSDDPNDARSKRSDRHIEAIRFCHGMVKNAQKHTKRKLKKAAHSARQEEIREEQSDEQKANSELSALLQHTGKTEMPLTEGGGPIRNWAALDQNDLQLIERPSHSRGISDDSARLSHSDADFGAFYDSDGSESLLSLSQRDETSNHRRMSSNQSLVSDTADDMNWTEVGARIGMRILSSEHVQRAVASQDTAERILDISKKVEKKLNGDSNELSEAHVSHHNSATGSPGSTPGARGIRTSNNRTMITPIKPVHSMWTSAAAALPMRDSQSSVSDLDELLRQDLPDPPSPSIPSIRRLTMGMEEGALPPRSPGRKSVLRRQWSTGSTGKAVKFLEKEEVANFAVSGLRDFGSSKSSAPIADKVAVAASSDIGESGCTSTEVVLIPEQLTVSASMRRLVASACKQHKRRPLLQPGIKMVVPIYPSQPGPRRRSSPSSRGFFQMATVVSCTRLYVRNTELETLSSIQGTNCLSIKVNLDGSFLRDGAFAQMTLRIMDSWSDRYMPRHSKFPIGSCVATSFGVGILVGWRVEDDCHIVRSLWQRKGPGSGSAYLNRDALHGTVEAAVGFPVDTTLGEGVVLSYVGAGRQFKQGRYFVLIKNAGRYKGQVMEFNRCDIVACHGPEFVPVIELIREGAQYQIQVDTYKMALQNQPYNESYDERKWRLFSEGFQIIWSAFLKAVDEDEEFDHGVNEFFSTIISFLEGIDNPKPEIQADQGDVPILDQQDNDESASVTSTDSKQNPYAWFVNDLFGGVFGNRKSEDVLEEEPLDLATAKSQWNQAQYDMAFAIIRALMRTVTIARAEAKDNANLKLTLSITYEFLLFVKTVIKIQQKNVSAASLAVWERAIEEIVSTFGPLKARMEKIGKGIVERIERQGNKAKRRILRFVDIVVSDEALLLALERGHWEILLEQVEKAFVRARIIDEASRASYHKTISFIVNHLTSVSKASAAERNNEKVAFFAKILKWLASPRRSLLKLVRRDSTLEILQRILVRVFKNDPEASRMIVTHAFNVKKLRQLRMLKDFSISRKLWLPILDAADQELTWAVSRMPDTSKRIMGPLSKLFSLGVTQFHKIGAGRHSADWLDFLMEDEAIALIHKIDVELIMSVEAMSKDMQEVMLVLPYYASIDEDLLKLMDEMDIDKFLKEASDAIVDGDRLSAFIREKSTIAIQKFLNYLPKMSIPVEQRPLVDNWMITCRNEDGGDLTLSCVSLNRENLTCQVMGGESIFFQNLSADENAHYDVEVVLSNDIDLSAPNSPEPSESMSPSEHSVLDQIRDLIVSAKRHGCWRPGVGGVGLQPNDKYVASVLKGLPVTSVLNTGIELWRDLEIDDDELMEIAIKDVAFQIQLQQQREESYSVVDQEIESATTDTSILLNGVVPSDSKLRRRFNPRLDPTLLFLEMKRLTVTLEKFRFLIEKKDKTIFDPVFEGSGRLSIQNASIKLRVECRKERINKMGAELAVPVLHCPELEVQLERVEFAVQNTGADWILNKAVMQFADNITEVVEANLKEQVRLQVGATLEKLNSYFAVNPDHMLSVLGITMDDLDENLVWV